MNWDTNMALWFVTHADGRFAVVRAESGPLAMQMLGWKAARFEMLTKAGPAWVILTAPAPPVEHDYQRYIEVLNEPLDTLPQWSWPKDANVHDALGES